MAVCVRRAACSAIFCAISGRAWPTLSAPMPPVKSRSRLPSTSVTAAPSPRSRKTGCSVVRPRATAALRRSQRARLRGPGISVLRWMVAMAGEVPQKGLGPQASGELAVGEVVLDFQDGGAFGRDRLFVVLLRLLRVLQGGPEVGRGEPARFEVGVVVAVFEEAGLVDIAEQESGD